MQISAYTKDSQGNYLSVTPEFVSFTKAKHPDEILGKNDHDLPWTSYAAQIFLHDNQVMHTCKSQMFIEKPIINGKQYIRQCYKSPLIGQSGKVIGITGMSFSISPSTLISLTAQQTACLKAFAKGGSIKKIGKELGLSPRTVEHYLNTVKIKLSCDSKNELILQAVARGLIHP